MTSDETKELFEAASRVNEQLSFPRPSYMCFFMWLTHIMETHNVLQSFSF